MVGLSPEPSFATSCVQTEKVWHGHMAGEGEHVTGSKATAGVNTLDRTLGACSMTVNAPRPRLRRRGGASVKSLMHGASGNL
jgi:hypothetical protein